MSFFDPYHVSEYTGYYTKKGQVIQKRHVDRNYPLSERDKEKAIKVINAFGFKAVPYSYMPIEKYTMFEGRTLSYENVGSIGPNEGFSIKLKNLYSFLPDLPIFNQVSSQNVEEFNIESIITGIWFRSDGDQVGSVVRLVVGSGLGQFSNSFSALDTQTIRISLSPYFNDGFVFRFRFRGTESGDFQLQSVSNARKGQLQEYLITGDKYLYEQIHNNNLTDQRLEANVLEINNDTTTTGDVVNLSEIAIYFSVNVEVIYKTYLD